MLEKLPESVGHALQGQRAGLHKILFNRIDLRNGMGKLQLSSLAFADHAPLPARYTADGESISPPLHWQGVPDTAAMLVLIVEDADSPTPEPFVQAVAVDIDPRRNGILEGELRDRDQRDGHSPHLGCNSLLKQGWLPPDPLPGHGVHRYAFQLFALSSGEPFSDAPGRHELAEAVHARAIASGLLIGTYERENRIKLKDTASAGVAESTADSAGAETVPEELPPAGVVTR
jgi:Raf kinase inhibitor-like YbhB/YbcL family protein